ncbi:hypothetical protein [Sulfurospirillum oryzae]|uniref:hypothetical protein n=1 Tax=Sulfurospirillum oryzae TaxID=2976535 RepID=UPI0021E86CD0|nr:hypothetical protein [Sulfurospirillum oryzae]
MAAGTDQGEMNPFISYVDLFSSVILVLLLFVLIMFVNVGYYMQFNSKNVSSTAAQEVVSPQTQSKESSKVVFVTAKDPSKVTTTQSSSDVGENTLTKQADKSTLADYKESDLIIIFKDNDYFVNKSVVSQLIKTMEKILKVKPTATFVISVGDSKKLISSTQTKQVSLGRVLSFKNSLEAVPELKNKIQINYKQQEQIHHEFGYLKVDVK